ncbi:chitin synthase-domain-containing protein, partial [Paraphysoderma sedebokerense]
KKIHKIHNKIQSVNTILSAFGNAQTSNNLRSSRFGRFTEIQFNESHKIVGYKTLEYLLDKVRVTSVPMNERSFHVFYYLLAGASPEQKDHLRLTDPSLFEYLKTGIRTFNKSDAEEFQTLATAMKSIGLSKKTQSSIFQLLACIMHLGNVQFIDASTAESDKKQTHVKDRAHLEFVADLLGIETRNLEDSLLTSTQLVGRDVCTVYHTPEQARQHCDTLAKTLYALLFTWLVEYTNSRLSTESMSTIISILEFPGFEISQTGQSNFWNFCVNLAEEKLANFTSKEIFETEVEQFFQDGISVAKQQHDDNSRILKTLLGSSNSLVGILNRQSGQTGSTFKSLSEAIVQHHAETKLVKVSNSVITIKHSNQQVSYDASRFISENRDIISTDFITLFRGGDGSPASTNAFVAGLFSLKVINPDKHPKDKKTVVGGHVPGKPLRKPSIKRLKRDVESPGKENSPILSPTSPTTATPTNTVLSQFESSLSELFEDSIVETNTWFLYCLSNPANTSKSPAPSLNTQIAHFNIPSISKQVTSFPNKASNFLRLPYTKLVSHFGHLLSLHSIDESRTLSDRIDLLLFTLGLPPEDRTLGREYAYLSWKAFVSLERELKRYKDMRKQQKETGTVADDDSIFQKPKPTYLNWDDNASYVSEEESYMSDNNSVYDAFSVGTGFYANGHNRDGGSDGNSVAGESTASYLDKIKIHDAITKDAPDTFDPLPVRKKPKKVEVSRQRKRWLNVVWFLTWWIPSFCLSCCGMKAKDVQIAWREKVALCIMIYFLSATVIFFIAFLGPIICSKKNIYSLGELEAMSNGNDKIFAAAYGIAYNVAQFRVLNEQRHDRAMFSQLAGQDISSGFLRKPRDYCAFVTSDQVTLENPLNPNNTLGNLVYSGHRNRLLRDANFGRQLEQYLEAKFYRKGVLAMEMSEIKAGWQVKEDETPARRVAIDGVVYDMTNYYQLGSIGGSNPNQAFLKTDNSAGGAADSIRFDLHTYILQIGKDNPDLTKDEKFMNVWRRSPELRNCFNNLMTYAVVDQRNSPQCLATDYVLFGFSIILCLVIGIKFLAAILVGWGGDYPEKMDKFVMIQVPCVTEGEESLQKAIDSLATTTYDDRRKLMVIICDGMIVGRGNDRPTPRIVLDILKVDPNLDPEPLSYQAIGEGNKQHNMAKVYSGLYEIEGHLVPYLVIVKVGKPSERHRPGNRGKRDSQMILMRFLNKLHYDHPMSPLELELRHHIQHIIGIDPRWYEYLLMVDADTQVLPDSLTNLIAFCVTDTSIVGCCGETRLENEKESFTTMIQVYEYFISHHLSKAFESLFGSVTCLPGCFCLYRIYSSQKNKPLLCCDNIVNEYGDCHVNTLHKKNLLALGEDRYLTTLILKNFPNLKTKFTPSAMCYTIAPETFKVLLSQRRRWINSTFHNLVELFQLKELCGFCCFSMRFVVLIDLFATIIQPATVVYLGWLIYLTVDSVMEGKGLNFVMVSLILLAAIYGVQAVVFILKKEWSHVIWMIIYILAIPIFSFYLPIYSFWRFDDFSWGNTRVVLGADGKKQVIAEVEDEDDFDISQIKHIKWADFEAEYMDNQSLHDQSDTQSQRSFRPGTVDPSAMAASPPAYPIDDRTSYYGGTDPRRLSVAMSERIGYVNGAVMSPSVVGGPTASPNRMSVGSFNSGAGAGVAGGMSNFTSMASLQSNMNMSSPLLPASSPSMAPVGSPGFGASAGAPTDEELVFEIRRIISTADLMKLTKKQVREELSALFSIDLSSRKEFINRTIDVVLEEYAS